VGGAFEELDLSGATVAELAEDLLKKPLRKPALLLDAVDERTSLVGAELLLADEGAT
jgi:hypothetical protein